MLSNPKLAGDHMMRMQSYLLQCLGSVIMKECTRNIMARQKISGRNLLDNRSLEGGERHR